MPHHGRPGTVAPTFIVQIMISNDQGIISIPEELIRDFTQLLVGFYESGNTELIARFIYDNCIDGLAFTS